METQDSLTEIAARAATLHASMQALLVDDIDAAPSALQLKVFDAVEKSPNGDPRLLRELIEQGADPYCSSHFGAVVLTPLQLAVRLGHNGWISAYADLGLNLDAKSRLGGDAATAAVIYKNLEALDELRLHGACFEKSRCNGAGLMSLAVYHQSESVVRKLHALGVDIHDKAEDGCRPIHEASNSVEMTRLLVELGADLKSVNDRMQTSAHLAADSVDGSPEVLLWLLANGANLLMIDETGKSAADLAMTNPGLAHTVRAHLAAREARIVLECMELARTGNTPPPHAMPRFAGEGAIKRMSDCAAFGTTDEVDAVVAEFGLVPLLKGPNPISVAARKGNNPMIHHLIELGFSVDSLGDRGVTPLADSIVFEEYGSAVTLLDAGADVNLKSADGKSALEAAKEDASGRGETIILSALARRAAAAAANELGELTSLGMGVRP